MEGNGGQPSTIDEYISRCPEDVQDTLLVASPYAAVVEEYDLEMARELAQ